MTPQDCIAALDNALAAAGEDVVLISVVGPKDERLVNCRAFVTSPTATEIAAGVMQDIVYVTISQTEIKKHGWPNLPIRGARPYIPDPQVPVINNKLIVQGRRRNIEFVEARTMSGVVVRINMRAIG